jgi:hypothetical protein
MNDEPMMIDETEDEPSAARRTATSWKKARLIVPAAAAMLLAALFATEGSWEFSGTTDAEIAELRQAIDDYISEVEAQGAQEITMQTYDPLLPTADGKTIETLSGTFEKRMRVSEIAGRMNLNNEGKAEAEFVHKARLHNRGGRITPDELAEAFTAGRRAWQIRDIPVGVWRTFVAMVKAAAITFVVCWLLVRAAEGVWWFLIDRLHDIANAVRRS